MGSSLLILNMDMTPTPNMTMCIIVGFLVLVCLAYAVYMDVRG